MQLDQREHNRQTLEDDGFLISHFSTLEFGNLIGYFLPENELLPNLYIVVAEREALSCESEEQLVGEDFIQYQALITLDGEILVDFGKMNFIECYGSETNKNFYFTFELNEGEQRRSFHIKKEDGEYQRVQFQLSSNFPVNFSFHKTEFLEYWLCEGINQFNIHELQIYAPEQGVFVSNVFQQIDFLEGVDAGYFAYVQKFLYDIDPEEPETYISYTSWVGYLNKDFIFATDIFDTDSEEFIPTSSWHTLLDFDEAVERCKNKMYLKYRRKQKRINDALEYIVAHPNPLKKPSQKQAKILTFSDYNG